MIAEIIPEAYDALGRKVLRPDLRRKGVHPTFPVGRYVSQLLTVTCESILDIRKFLATCKAVSDKEQFGTETTGSNRNTSSKRRKEIAMTSRYGPGVNFWLWVMTHVLSGLGLDSAKKASASWLNRN